MSSGTMQGRRQARGPCMQAGRSDSRFFVVGGPVQPDRACYMERPADEQLYRLLAAAEYCHVLAPPDVGKSSLAAHAAERLRAAGQAVAIVDVAQISNRGVSEDAGRWYYSLAYRILRDLRIRFDLQGWWQDRAYLTGLQRLREFFLEVLLREREEPVVVFIDRIEAILGHEVSRDLFGAIRACYDARATVPDASRLTFALLGAQGVGQRLPLGHASPFSISTAVELGDFDLAVLETLVDRGLGLEHEVAAAIAQRLWHWTSGHPYLSQKILRGLARRDAGALTPASVDQTVQRLFLGPNTLREEPHLAFVRTQLLSEQGNRSARLNLYGRVRKGVAVPANLAIPLHRELLCTGVVVVAPDGRLALRNRIYAAVFSTLWVNRNLPFSWRGLAAALAVVALILLLPAWYAEYLPRPYVRALTEPGVDFVTAMDAWERLGFLPGFGNTADQLFADYLVRRSRQSSRLAEVARYGDYLMRLPGRQGLAAEVLAEFWDRRSAAALRSGDRDAAMLFASRALRHPSPRRRRFLGELLGEDFARLRWTLRPAAGIRDVAVDPALGLLSLLDSEQQVAQYRLADGRLSRRQALFAEEILPLQLSRRYAGPAKARRLSVQLELEHPRPADLVLELQAPSGRRARLSLDRARREAGGLSFDSRRHTALRPLLQEDPNGTWLAWLADTEPGVSGSLRGWSLAIDGRSAEAEPAEADGLRPIPEPTIAREARALLGERGRLALSWPAGDGVRGQLLVWHVAGGEILARLPRPEDFRSARFALGGEAVLMFGNREIVLRALDGKAPPFRIDYEPGVAPLLSADGRFLVVDSIPDGSGANALSVWDLAQRRERRRLVTGAPAALVATDSAATLLAVSDGNRLLRLWSVDSGQLVAELALPSRPVAAWLDAAAEWLAAADAAGHLYLWNLDEPAAPLMARRSAAGWRVAFDAGRVAFGSLEHGFEVIGLPSAARLAPVLRHSPGRRRGPNGPGLLHFAGDRLLTGDRAAGFKAWQLDRVQPAAGRLHWPVAAAVDPGGRRVAVASASGDVRILPADGSLQMPRGPDAEPEFIGHLKPVTGLVFEPGGELLASAALDGSLRVWEAASGMPRPFFASQQDPPALAMAFSSDRARLFTAGRSVLQLVDSVNGHVLARQAIQATRPQLAVADEDRLLVAGDRGALSEWRWRAGTLSTLLGGRAGVLAVAVHPDGERLAVAGTDRRVELWSGAGERLPRRLRLPMLAERMWFGDGGRELVVQGGLWVQRLAVNAEGLRRGTARLLQQPPDAAALDPASGELLLMTDMQAARPRLLRLRAGEPVGEAVAAPATELEARLQAVLGLKIDQWGELQPLAP
ncbi:MAG: hypothetical protein D6727_04000 [Gammaproteobacteria bacterium]|nr:MAG: hypothetical protein D6727_04000 [Gammaproteobacteria bacterium]